MKKVLSGFLIALLCAGALAPARAAETGISLDDLGFEKSQTTGDAALQARLEKRSRMLKTHQLLGLATALPMTAALLSGEKASGETDSKSGRRLHAGLGMAAAGMYFTTAYFSIAAPEGPSHKSTGATKIHRALAFIHFPAMLMVPILGYQAKRQLDNGEEVHGLAKYHSTVAGVAAGAFYTSLLVMTINFGGKKHA